MVPGWVGTSLVRTFRGDSSGQSILTRQVPGETDVPVWRRMVDYAARCGAGSWPQTAYWAITPAMSRHVNQNARRGEVPETLRTLKSDGLHWKGIVALPKPTNVPAGRKHPNAIGRDEVILGDADDADRHWSLLSRRSPVPRR